MSRLPVSVRSKLLVAVGLVLFAVATAAALQPEREAKPERWWMEEPFRLVQTNLRETDSGLDPKRLVQRIADFPANVLLFGMGGIVAHYNTSIDFHRRSPHMPPGQDTFGEVLEEAHARGIRVIGRFDFSKAPTVAFEKNPEWFFRKANGEPATYNGLYATCINGYYREPAMTILTEALERHDVGGLFFNMFGQPSSDYSGNRLGLCHCKSCQKRFQAQYGRLLPSTPDDDYREFIATAVREVTRDIARLIHSKRPRAGFFTYTDEYVDGIMSESNTGLDRPLPLWPYSASDNVGRARNSQPDKMAVNLAIGFVDIPYRFVTVPPAEIQMRLYQNMAHGSGPAFVALGTLDQEDMSGIRAARPVFQFHAAHEELYVGQESAARVLLFGEGGDNYRGLFRILSEQHIPFAASDNLDLLTGDRRDFDLVITAGPVPAPLDQYVREGGRLLVVGTEEPAGMFGEPVRRWTETRSAYFRIRDHSIFPSLRNTQLLFLAGDYVEMAPVGKPLLTLIPPSMFGPPEKVHIDRVETNAPGVLMASRGQGRVAYVPWDVGSLYYRHSSPGHMGLVTDLIDHLLPNGRQLKTNAHPLVEMTVMRQPRSGRTLVHLVNISGHSSTAYFSPIEMRDIDLAITGRFKRARSVRLNRALALTQAGGHMTFSLPRLGAYDVIVLE
ncbi:MAG: hypothetical protein ACRD2X_11785 [Vicinamibacteraceae bacterium]